MCISKRSHIDYFLPSFLIYTEHCTEKDNPQGPSARCSTFCTSPMAKEPQRAKYAPWIHHIWIRRLYTVKHRVADWLYSYIQLDEVKERRENQCQLYSSKLLIWASQWHPRSLSRLESQGWTGVGLRQPGRVPSLCPSLVIIITSEPLLKSHLSACLDWDQIPEWDWSLEGCGRQIATPPAHLLPLVLPTQASVLESAAS